MKAHELKELRMEKGWTLKKTAQLLGVATSTYRDWESGAKIPAGMLLRLTAVFGPSSRRLYGIKDDYSEEKEILKMLEEVITKLTQLWMFNKR